VCRIAKYIHSNINSFYITRGAIVAGGFGENTASQTTTWPLWHENSCIQWEKNLAPWPVPPSRDIAF